LPRIGLCLTIPGDYGAFSWYGRGPQENYWDRKAGALVGVYDGSVDDQYVPYIKPQENGNKADVRWAALMDRRGAGLMAIGLPLFEVSVHRFTAEDLSKANHTFEVKGREEITWTIDYKQSGLGGGSCGPDTLPQYLLTPDPVRFSFRMRPLSPRESDLMALSKQRIRA